MTTLLLSSVFGPYGVDDEYGHKENKMELFHNQVTREQGMFSLRIHHPSFGLHFLAENVEAGTKVLDFPSKSRFIREIKKGYDYVGISFITPNFTKAKVMAGLIRQHSPKSKIILGGHGTRIENIDKLIDCDHICYGEGVYWLRNLLGEDPQKPIKHPVVESALTHRVVGINRSAESCVLIPGVGCPNACRFCATSHFFDYGYTPYLKTGDDIFNTCQEIEAKTGLTEFFVMDENFLKDKSRAERLLELMEASGKYYRFGIFSSAEAIHAVGVEFMVKLGVYFLWLGVESKFEIYEKNRGIDFHALIGELRQSGIAVLASGILFTEKHNRSTIDEEIEFLTSLKADFVQFMELGPLPQTALYKAYKKQNLLLEEIPYEQWHGQDKIWFKHPHFNREETADLLRGAFERDFQQNGASIVRYFESVVQGALNTTGTSPILKARQRQFLEICADYRPVLRWLRAFAPNKKAKDQVKRVEEKYAFALGSSTPLQRAQSMAALPFVLREYLLVKTNRNNYQPPLVETTYRLNETKFKIGVPKTWSLLRSDQLRPIVQAPLESVNTP